MDKSKLLTLISTGENEGVDFKRELNLTRTSRNQKGREKVAQ